MKQIFVSFSLALLLCGGLGACKDKAKDTTTTTTVDRDVNTTAPVEVNTDDALRKGVVDATKDFPGVMSTVSNGEITLTGEIKREDWQRLNQTLMSLNPKRINSDNLTIK